MPRKLTKEIFIQRSLGVHGLKYGYDNVNYINNQTKVSIICPIHGKFNQTPNSHMSGCGCPLCSGKYRKTMSEFQSKARKIHLKKYDYSLVKYENSKTKVKIICGHHGIFEQTPDTHLNRKRGCPKCKSDILSEKFKKKLSCFIREANLIHEDTFDYSKFKYKNAKTKGEIICPKHGIFLQSPDNHLKGKRCPNCKWSSGEELIALNMKKLNLIFESQKSFKECRDKRCLRFDFFVPAKNTCVEYNGKQHYEFIRHFHRTLNEFNKYKKRDEIKKAYCKNNNIKLIIIPYWDKVNIDKLLRDM